MLALLCAMLNVAWGADKWVKTSISDLVENDIIVIVDQTSGKAMSNSNGTSSAPSAVNVTFNNDKSEITSTVNDNLKWRFIKNKDNFQFQQYATSTNSNYLYTTNTNDGVRVGTNANNNKFVFESDFLKNVATNRYVGYYTNSNDWRCYTSINANIKTNVIAFYKKTAAINPYTITALSKNTDYGSVSLSGNTITAIPNTGYCVSTTNPYTVTSGTATVSQDGNAFTVTASSNCTVQINFEESTTPQPSGNVYTLLSDDLELEEGDYIIYYEGKAMKNTAASNRLEYKEVTPTDNNNKITTDDNTIVWHIAPSNTTGYWTIKSLGNSQYAASTGSNNQAKMISSEDDHARWSFSPTRDFVNKWSSDNSKNPYLRNNGTYGFACYNNSVGGILRLYKSQKLVTTPTISPEGGYFIDSQEVTITAAEGCTIYYTTDGTTTPTTASTLYSEPFTITASTIVKAIAVKGDLTSAVSEAIFTKAAAPDTYELVTNIATLAPGDQIIIVNENKNYALSTNQKDSNRGATSVTESDNIITINSSSDVQVITLKKNGVLWYFDTGAAGFLYASSSGSNQLKTEPNPDDNASASIGIDNGIATITFQGSNSRNVLQFNSGNSSNLLFACYSSASQDDVRIYRKIASATRFTLTISPSASDGKSYYATMSALGHGNFIVPEGVEVSAIKLNENKKIEKTVSYVKNNVISGDGAYLVKAVNAGSYDFDPTTNGVTKQVSENWLYPSFANVNVTAPIKGNQYLFYQLSRNANLDANSVSFFFGKDCETGGSFKFNSDHKAYLAVPSNMFPDIQSASSLTFEDNNTNGINGISVGELSKGGIYTLSGVRVDSKNLPKGIYIVDGKKQVVK